MESELHDVENATDDTSDAFKDSGDSALTFGEVLKANVLGQAILEGVKQLASAVKSMAGEFIESAAAVKAEGSQFEQTFGDMGSTASAAIQRVASLQRYPGYPIEYARRSDLCLRPFFWWRCSGEHGSDGNSPAGHCGRRRSTMTAVWRIPPRAYSPFLKGNYANDAALGLSCTETTRNAAATELFGKKFSELTEIQKQPEPYSKW